MTLVLPTDPEIENQRLAIMPAWRSTLAALLRAAILAGWIYIVALVCIGTAILRGPLR